CKLLLVGSSDQYGIVKEEDCPIKETLPVHPLNPYAVSKQAQEDMIRCLAIAKRVNVVFTRSFNHTGPGQRKGFAVPDFAGRILDVKKNGGELHVGNLAAQRDFSDVRDSVRAYRLLAEKGRNGEVYNVGSGKAHSIEWILEKMLELAGIQPNVVVDQENIRPLDMPLLVADTAKINKDTGYVAQVDIEKTLSDVLQFCELGNGL
ncbi:GDP-mannose 4,6-dehydratase, partial [Christensenellaceae bacterium OttesenSCG-928-K19]|nr:GDP-mannose 4,6-dehydratase [Christensenellaceae bacterium OttesenSCG-928-K19]